MPKSCSSLCSHEPEHEHLWRGWSSNASCPRKPHSIITSEMKFVDYAFRYAILFTKRLRGTPLEWHAEPIEKQMDARNFDAVWNLVLQLQLFDSLQNYECHRRSLPSFDVSHRKWWEERSTYQKQAVCRFERTKNLLRSEWVSGRTLNFCQENCKRYITWMKYNFELIYDVVWYVGERANLNWKTASQYLQWWRGAPRLAYQEKPEGPSW